MRYLSLVIVPVVFALAQCSLDDEEEPKYPDAASYCVGRARAECAEDVLSACAAEHDVCVAERQRVCQAALPTGKTYDSAKAEDCITTVESSYADVQLTFEELEANNAACGLVFSGSGVEGAPCLANDACRQSEGLLCVIHPSVSVSGTCQHPVSVSGGESCAEPYAQCLPGFHCGTTSRCDANGNEGDPCNAVLPCKSSFKCSTSGFCEAKLVNGATCALDGDCASGICLSGSNVCVAKIVLAPNEPYCLAVSGRD